MAKLFPPLVDGIIPAFYSENGIVSLTIPFSLNRAVSTTQISGFSLKVKTVQSSSYLLSTTQTDAREFELEDSPWVKFSIDSSKFKVGQFYKLQIAFIDTNGDTGYYSSVGVAKYTARPKLDINNFTVGILNMHSYQYTGQYSQEGGDPTERVYSYRFDVYDNINNLVYTSGDQLHNRSNDVEIDQSYDTYELAKDLPVDVAYRIKYTITTNNGLTLSTPKYRIVQKASIPPEILATLSISCNYENGYIDVNLVGDKDEYNLETPATGAFLLSRSSEDSNFTEWDEISRFKLAAQAPSRQLWRDFTVEQGKKYQYSLQQYSDVNNNKLLYSDRILSNTVYSDFEDAFLYDGERQLKIKYNPKVTSFKVDILENKVDTIGSKHPFINRNGNAYYKEFPISGLISYYMDSDELFISQEDDTATTNLTSSNIAKERQFKTDVYSWLTNGEAKLFRSPNEGNFIVRLMNISMTPNDTLGRMLHTFSGTAYEIADFNYDNLNSYGFISLVDPEVSRMRWRTVQFYEKNEDGVYEYKGKGKTGERLNSYLVQMVRFDDMMPGDMIYITYENGENEEIQIGVTGSYYIDTDVAIKDIQLSENNSRGGSMTYGYYSVQSNTFDKIVNIEVTEVPVRQFIGEHDVIQELTNVYDNGQWINDPKTGIVTFLHLAAQRRTIEKLVYNSTSKKYYKDMAMTEELTAEDADPFTLYKVGHWEEKVQVNSSRTYYDFITEKYYDFFNNKEYGPDDYQPYIQINDDTISVEETRDFELHKPGLYDTLLVGNGVTLNLTYQIRTTEYYIEDTTYYVSNLPKLKQVYEDAVQKLKDAYVDYENGNEYDFDSLRQEITDSYVAFIKALVEAQELEATEDGDL